MNDRQTALDAYHENRDRIDTILRAATHIPLTTKQPIYAFLGRTDRHVAEFEKSRKPLMGNTQWFRFWRAANRNFRYLRGMRRVGF